MLNYNKFVKTFKKTAFTLAEVLITLGIIGVVAAMTIPTLMTNIHHMQYTARLKKFYSTMKQAMISAEDEYGDVTDWDITLSFEDYLKKYFSPYLQGTIVINAGENKINYPQYFDTNTYFMFNDGSFFSIARGSCIDICFDVNGWNKPNKLGYDMFRFLYCPAADSYWCNGEGGFCTFHLKNELTRKQRLAACKSASSKCSSLLEIDNWNFEKDYPYWK